MPSKTVKTKLLNQLKLILCGLVALAHQFKNQPGQENQYPQAPRASHPQDALAVNFPHTHVYTKYQKSTTENAETRRLPIPLKLFFVNPNLFQKRSFLTTDLVKTRGLFPEREVTFLSTLPVLTKTALLFLKKLKKLLIPLKERVFFKREVFLQKHY